MTIQTTQRWLWRKLTTVGGSWTSKPGNFGNAAGDKIQSGLSPLGKPLGKGLEQVGKPVGSVVDPLIGGVMRTGEAFGTQAGVGFGNKEGGPKAQEEAEGKKMKEPFGGKEQTGDNPLGL